MKRYIAGLLLLGLAFAPDPLPRADITGQEDEGSYTWTSTDTISINAGHVYEVNLTYNQSSSRWAAIYGNITGNIVLADQDNHYFYIWTVTDPSGSVVYASDAVTSLTLNGMQPATAADMPGWLEPAAGASDSWSNTFTNTETFTSPTGLTVANAPYTTTWQNGAQGTEFKTYSLKDASGNLVWAALVNNDKTSYSGGKADYQLLVPEDGTVGNTGTATTYNLFLELK